jgi:hypothetical protein
MNWGVMAGHLGWGIIEEEGWRKGPWTAEEDRLLIEYVRLHGEGRWNSVARLAGNIYIYIYIYSTPPLIYLIFSHFSLAYMYIYWVCFCHKNSMKVNEVKQKTDSLVEAMKHEENGFSF